MEAEQLPDSRQCLRCALLSLQPSLPLQGKCSAAPTQCPTSRGHVHSIASSEDGDSSLQCTSRHTDGTQPPFNENIVHCCPKDRPAAPQHARCTEVQLPPLIHLRIMPSGTATQAAAALLAAKASTLQDRCPGCPAQRMLCCLSSVVLVPGHSVVNRQPFGQHAFAMLERQLKPPPGSLLG